MAKITNYWISFGNGKKLTIGSKVEGRFGLIAEGQADYEDSSSSEFSGFSRTDDTSENGMGSPLTMSWSSAPLISTPSTNPDAWVETEKFVPEAFVALIFSV